MYREGLWSQCLADAVNTHVPGTGIGREAFVQNLASGFPWHEADLEHAHLCEADALWRNLQPTLEHGAGLDAILVRTMNASSRHNLANLDELQEYAKRWP